MKQENKQIQQETPKKSSVNIVDETIFEVIDSPSTPKQKISQPVSDSYIKDNKDQAQNRKFDVLFLHDFICHKIDIRKLLSGTGRTGEKRTTYTVDEALSEIGSIDFAEKIIVQGNRFQI